MTEDAHNIALHGYRIENLEKNMGALTSNVLTLAETVRVTNAAIRTFHDTQEAQAKIIEAHAAEIAINRAYKAKIKGGWIALSFLVGFIASGATLFALIWPIIHQK